MKHKNARPSPLPVLLLLTIAASCSEPHAEAGSGMEEGAEAADVAEPADAPSASFAPYRERLLEVAFESVSMMPLEPHIKNRSRAQEAVVETCFELDQPERALRYVERIDNWRRGGGYADYAFYRARHGLTDDVDAALKKARDVASSDESARTQAWRLDQVRAKLARAYLLLGNGPEADRFAAGLSVSEAGRVQVADAMVVDPEELDSRLAATRTIVASGDFDQMRGMLDACVELYDRFNDDEERRARTLETIRACWSKLPTSARVEVAFELTERAVRHERSDEALALVEEAQLMVGGTRWTVEDLIPLQARIARLRSLVGDLQRARTDNDAALALYEEEREKIVDIYRADALRPIAEAYQAMGDTAAAAAVYEKALVAGFQNPNARPRAEDLSETLCSMALHEVEPDDELWARIEKIQAALDHPW